MMIILKILMQNMMKLKKENLKLEKKYPYFKKIKVIKKFSWSSSNK